MSFFDELKRRKVFKVGAALGAAQGQPAYRDGTDGAVGADVFTCD